MIKIRQFSSADLNRVIEIGQISFPQNQTVSREYFEDCFKKHPESFIVAENNEKIVGYGIGGVKEGLAKILNMAVVPNYQGRGIGTSIVNYFKNYFKNNAQKEVFLRVRTNNEKAISLYKNSGFRVIEIKKRCYRNGDDGYDDGYIMKAKLG